LHCHKNPNQAKRIEAMLDTILNDIHPSRPAFASCIEQHLQRPRQQIQCTAYQLSSHFNDTLQMTIEGQMQISWHQLLLDYMSKKWLMLSSLDTSSGTLNLAAGRNRIHSALKAMTLLVHQLWLGRNQVLLQHKDEKDQEIYSMESAEL
jgi:tetrahydromethanopterin S-methyltransferase subunit B